MDFFIKKIFDGKSDELVHLQFKKFSKGEFKNKAMIVAKKTSGKYSISTTQEYSNEFVRAMAEKLGEEKTSVTGVVVSTRDLTGELDFQNKKQFMGVKQYIIEREMSGTEILNLCEKFPSSFIGLSFKTGDSELKIKPKAPKSAKPSTKGEEKPKVDFCKLKTSDINLISNLIFDPEARDFNKIEIKHDFFIEDIIIPEELKQEKDFSKIREMAKRKGKIIRELDIDGRKIKKECEFEA
ncbi:hypothetical protein GF386_01840 [Candidatus Pacearchaeota archaeon]|nr:hypothetical protein [Candidatus Pacearchaeota archaeon]MBD3282920.1 hypothetical protein [Candidatus Pacearchaeota archaeon]